MQKINLNSCVTYIEIALFIIVERREPALET